MLQERRAQIDAELNWCWCKATWWYSTWQNWTRSNTIYLLPITNCSVKLKVLVLFNSTKVCSSRWHVTLESVRGTQSNFVKIDELSANFTSSLFSFSLNCCFELRTFLRLNLQTYSWDDILEMIRSIFSQKIQNKNKQFLKKSVLDKIQNKQSNQKTKLKAFFSPKQTTHTHVNAPRSILSAMSTGGFGGCLSITVINNERSSLQKKKKKINKELLTNFQFKKQNKSHTHPSTRDDFSGKFLRDLCWNVRMVF